MNTEFAHQHPCSAGSFNNITNTESVASCIPCTGGSYCPTPGLTDPVGLCAPGWYCTLSATQAMPSDATGGMCVAGEYCPQGAIAQIPCDPGSLTSFICNISFIIYTVICDSLVMLFFYKLQEVTVRVTVWMQ